MGSADVQQGVTADLAARFGVQPERVHSVYRQSGGMCSLGEVSAYLLDGGMLTSLQRDLVSDAVNELLNVPYPRSAGQRAPYTHHDVAAAAGYGPSEFDGDHVDRRLRRPLSREVPVHGREPARLEDLRASNLLDPAVSRSMSLQRLPTMARTYFGTMGSALTLIDADKQRTPVADGVPTADVPRDLSFCNAAIAFDTTMVVPDTRLDDRFRTNPYVVGAPRIRFYAGHPINGPGGHRIGVLCLLDDTPHTFSSSDRRKLRTLAALVQLEMVPPRTT